MQDSDQKLLPSGSGGGCFPATTLIATPHGKKPIESIQVGDEVYCFDWNRNIHIRPVIETSQHEDFEVWRYHYWGGFIDATPNHGFLTEYGAFRPIHEFVEDDHLIDSRWQFRSLLRREYLDRQTVFNFRVQDYHSYLVGDHELACMNGGAGKAASGPTEQDDSGRSTSRGVVTEILSEGPIEGLVRKKKSIYLDKTAVQAPNGSLNFTGFKYAFRRGLPNQRELPDFANEVSEETNVGVEVTQQQGAVTRSIVNSELDVIRIRMAVQLQKYEEDGDINGSEVRFRVLVKQGTDPFEERLDQTIKGKYSSLTEFEYEFKVRNLNGTRDSFQVRIIRESDDSDSQRHQRVLRWQSYTEIITNKLNYPYSALIAMQFKAEQFDSIPSRSYQVNGRIINIPTNATVADDGGLFFSGVWDGTFYNPGKACSDPAWQLYDLMTNTRYGLGRKLKPERIDKYSLYQCSLRNNELINDGLGGVERRYRCNTVLQSREKAWDVINTFCSCFHTKPFWRNGKINFWQDRPGDVVQQFTQADVVDGDFIYSSTAVRTRFTVAAVTWFNPKNFFEREVEVVEDPEGIERYGIQKSEVVAFGCTSRAQAYRFGKWVLFSSLYELEMVSFTARSYAVYCSPGDIVQVADPRRSAVRYSGLIAGSTTNVISLDAPVELKGSGFQISCLMPNGTVQTRSVTNGPGIHNLISVSPAFSGRPQVEANWIISTSLVKPQTFRILSVDLTPDPTQIEIRALQHYSDKYTAIEQDIPPLEIPIRQTLPDSVNPPSNVLANHEILYAGNIASYILTANWTSPLSAGKKDPSISSFVAEWTKDNIEWQGTQSVQAGTLESRWTIAPSAGYAVRVAAVDYTGRSSAWVTSPFISVSVWHPDVLDYRNRLAAIGVSLSSADMAALNVFVAGIYELELRVRSGASSDNIIDDCCPFAGTALNGVKLWYRGLSSVALQNFEASDWSRARGLDPGNSGTKYGALGFGTGALFTEPSATLAFYSTKDALGGVDIGAQGDSAANRLALFSRATTTEAYFDCFNATTGGGRLVSTTQVTESTNDLFIGTRINSTSTRLYKNGVSIGFATTSGGNVDDVTGGLFLFALNNNGTPSIFSQRSCGFYAVGKKGILPSKAVEFDTLVRNLMIALGRS